MREFLRELELGIRLTDLQCPKGKRKNDIVLMDVAEWDTVFTDGEIRKINSCRVYLRAECLSDLCNAAVTRINDDAYDCLPSARIDGDDLWPRQL